MHDRVEQAKEAGICILPEEDVEREMYYDTEKMLHAAGYERYEISNYCKKGYVCRHNVGYWKRTEYLGFGLGAASLYKDTRYSNMEDLYQYISVMSESGSDSSFWGDEIYEDNVWDIQEDGLMIVQGKIQQLSVKDRMEEFMFLGLRMMEGISVKTFEEMFGRKYENVYGTVSDKLVEQGLLEQNGDNIRLTKRGIDISNYVMSEFLL